jgi:hypothetical protein
MSQIKWIKENTREGINDIRKSIAESLRVIQQEVKHIEKNEVKLCELQETLRKLEGVPE